MTTTASVLSGPRRAARPMVGSAARSSAGGGNAAAVLLTVSATTLALALVTMIYLHSVSVAELSPVSTTVSDLIFVEGLGWMFGVSAVLLAVASGALTVALARTRLHGGRLITAAMSLWSSALIVAVVFPTDPIGLETVSAVGEIHRYAGATMYVSLPLAGWLIYLRSGGDPAWTPYRRAVGLLSSTGAVLGLLFTVSHAPRLFPASSVAELFDGQLIHGLVERLLILCLFGLLLAIGLGVARVTQGRAARRDGGAAA